MSYSSKNPYGNKTHFLPVQILLCLILAKIHMVTKQVYDQHIEMYGLILAKIHMVTKPSITCISKWCCLILAKIHMVTKLMN